MKKFKGTVTVAKGIKLPKASLPKIRRRKGASNAGKYPDVRPSDFAGAAGKTSPYSFPINSLKRAKAAKSRAHLAPYPEGIEKAVYKKFPQLKPKKEKKSSNW